MAKECTNSPKSNLKFINRSSKNGDNNGGWLDKQENGREEGRGRGESEVTFMAKGRRKGREKRKRNAWVFGLMNVLIRFVNVTP